MKKILSLFLFSMLMVGCSSQESINRDDFAETASFVTNNFDTENIAQSGTKEDYLKDYDKKELADEVTVYTNQSNQIAYIQFRGITADKAELVLKEVGLPKEEKDDINLLVSKPDEFETEYDQRYLSYVLNDEIGIHVVAFQDEVADTMNLNGIYTVNVFYNLNIYDDFMSE